MEATFSLYPDRVPLGPFGTLGLIPMIDFAITVRPSTGVATSTWQVPFDTSLVGLEIYVRALHSGTLPPHLTNIVADRAAR